jgi:radical SAM protein with 4Fe4S-binding SPASM domain
VALATNGTLVSKEVAHKIVDAGVRRVSISLDGADAATHDAFRGIPGAFEGALRGVRNLRDLGMSVQINMSIARHNAHQLPAVLELARHLGADALHTFLLVPVGCGVDIAEEQMVPPDEYENILNWFYDRAQEGDIELKATCAPHYFRVVRQRRAAERRAASQAMGSSGSNGQEIGPTEMTMPGSTGIALRPPLAPLLTKEESPQVRSAESDGAHATPETRLRRQIGGGVVQAQPSPAAHPDSMQAMTKGCLAGTGVAFISHQGEVYPCGYLPVLAGNLHSQSLAEIWEAAPVFQQLRDSSKLKGKCGYCEFRNICMGCRARAFAATGDFMDEEPCCVYQPRRVDSVQSKPVTPLLAKEGCPKGGVVAEENSDASVH